MDMINRCPRCGVGQLLSWHELTEEERIVVARLPSLPSYSFEVRMRTHQWCTKCWYESDPTVTNA
jgi:hypothetical protein